MHVLFQNVGKQDWIFLLDEVLWHISRCATVSASCQTRCVVDLSSGYEEFYLLSEI
jgi:hypothetical protein